MTSATAEDAQQFTSLTDMDKIFDEMLDPGSDLTRVDGKDVEGTPTVGLKDTPKDKDEQGILYIAAEGEPYPLLIAPNSGPGGLTFLDWNEPVDIEAPPKSQVVDQKDVAKLAGG